MGRGLEAVKGIGGFFVVHCLPFFADNIYKLMKKYVYLIALLYLGFAVSGSLYGVGEKTIRLGGDTIWKMVNYRAGITEMNLVRPAPVVVLSSSGGSSSISSLDLAISFD